VADSFDPYHIWLGIPPAEQPADHYRLLGISRFESNLDVIANAADQRVRHLRGMQTGKRQAESQKLLNEIAAAAGVLLDQDKKQEYDAGLTAKMASRPAMLVPPTQSETSVPLFLRSVPSKSVPSTVFHWFAIGSVMAAVVAVIVLGIALGNRKPKEAAEGASPAKNSIASVSKLASPPSTPEIGSPSVAPASGSVPAPPSSPPSVSPNPAHRQNWEYGFGRYDSSGSKLAEFQPLGFCADDGGQILWGPGPHYFHVGSLVAMYLAKDRGHTANDSAIPVVRRWRHPSATRVQVSGEVEHPSMSGEGVRARLITGGGKKIWEANVKASSALISAEPFALQPGETLDLCVDCLVNDAYDTFKCRLHVAVLGPGDQASADWDSVADYRNPVPTSNDVEPTLLIAIEPRSGESYWPKVVGLDEEGVGNVLWESGATKFLGNGSATWLLFNPFAADYTFEFDAVRHLGDGPLVIDLPIDNRPGRIVIDGNKEAGYRSGLETVAGKYITSRDSPGVAQGQLIPLNVLAHISILQVSELVVGKIDIAGKETRFLSWKGNAPLGASDDWKSRISPRLRKTRKGELNLAIHSTGTRWSFTNARLTPLAKKSPEAIAASPASAPTPVGIAEAPTKSPLPIAPPVIPSVKPARLAIPSDAAMESARNRLKETFGDVVAKSKKPEEKLKLVAEFRAVTESEKDPAIRYVLLDTARRLAVGAQDVQAALLAAAEIAKHFETDPLDEQLQTLKLAAGGTLSAAARDEVVQSALALVETSRDAGRIDDADAASLLAVDLASKGKNLEQRKQVKQVRDMVLAYKKSADLVKEAETTLKTKPDDVAANLVVGKWHCFVLDDWAKGLPYLEKCSEPALATAAKAEKDPKNTLAIADAWYGALDKLQGADRSAAQRRAQASYAQAAKELTGLDQLRAGKRAEELQSVTREKSAAKTTSTPVIAADDKLKPGLIVRMVSGSQAIPTPILGTTMKWDLIVWKNVEVKSRKVLDLRDISASPLATGYIELDKDDTVEFTLCNVTCLIDGVYLPPLPTVEKKGPSYFEGSTVALFPKQLTKGRHTLVIGRIPLNTDRGVEFQVKRHDGRDCLFHSPKALEAELAKSVRLPNGGTSKGILLFDDNIKFSR
jgi:hypothetical protein